MSQGFVFYDPFAKPLSLQGVPQPGCYYQFYQTKTTTPAIIYSDGALSTPMSNPVYADGSGQFPIIYLDSIQQYRVILYSASGSVLQDVDPYGAPGAAGATLTVGPSSGTATEVIINQGSTNQGLKIVGSGGNSSFIGASTLNTGLGFGGYTATNNNANYVTMEVSSNEFAGSVLSNLPVGPGALVGAGNSVPLAIGTNGLATWYISSDGTTVQQNNRIYNASTNPGSQLVDMTCELQSTALICVSTLNNGSTFTNFLVRWCRLGPFVTLWIPAGTNTTTPTGGIFSITGLPNRLFGAGNGTAVVCPSSCFKNAGSALTSGVTANMSNLGVLTFSINQGGTTWSGASGITSDIQLSYNILMS